MGYQTLHTDYGNPVEPDPEQTALVRESGVFDDQGGNGQLM